MVREGMAVVRTPAGNVADGLLKLDVVVNNTRAIREEAVETFKYPDVKTYI